MQKKTDVKQSPDQTTKKTVYMGNLYIFYVDSIDRLYKDADLVIQGKVLGSKVEWMSHTSKPTADGAKLLTTIFTVEIVNYYKGNTDKKLIEVMQLGGETETEIYLYEDLPKINNNTEYIMILGKNPVIDNAFWLIGGGMQSLYQVDGNKLITSSSVNKLNLTFEDLSKLAETK